MDIPSKCVSEPPSVPRSSVAKVEQLTSLLHRTPAGGDGKQGQLPRRADELVATLQSAQLKLSGFWHGRHMLQSGRTSFQRKESFRRSLIGDAELSNALARLETAAARHVEANEFDVALRLIQDESRGDLVRTLAAGWISGSYRLDRLCLSIGREVRGVANRRSPLPRLVDVATSTQFRSFTARGAIRVCWKI